MVDLLNKGLNQSLFFIVLVFELCAEWPPSFNVLRGLDETGMDMDMDDVASWNGVPLKNSA